jgi:septum formation protein
MDKAGAYAVQERGGLLVDGIDGSPNTVIGLPLHRLPELFSSLGLDFWSLIDGG